MPYDDAVRAHGLDRIEGVLERLPFFHRAAGRRDIDHVHTQPLGGGLEGDPGSRAGLVEQVDQHAPCAGVLEGADVAGNGKCQVEQLLELLPAAVTDISEVIEWFSHVRIVTSFRG